MPWNLNDSDEETIRPSGSDGSTESIDESSLADFYRFAHGRQLHNLQSPYFLPFDYEELHRLQLEHQLLVALQGGLVFSSLPICQGRVLDIGSAGGTFSIALSDEYPELEVYSLDLTPSQPLETPPNCTFEVSNYGRAGYLFEARRGCCLVRISPNASYAVPRDGWHAFVAAVAGSLSPGGLINFSHEVLFYFTLDGSPLPPAIDLLNRVLCYAIEGTGAIANAGERFAGFLEAAGSFRSIAWSRFNLSLCCIDPNETASLARNNNLRRLESLRPLLFSAGYDEEEVETLISGALAVFHDPTVCLYTAFHLVSAVRL